MMSAKDILIKAVQCDQAGRILEAQYNYQEGIECLMELVEDEQDVARKKVYYDRIKEYIDRAEQIKKRVQKHVSQGKLVSHIPIDEGSSGHSYASIFGKYLNVDVKEVLIEEPYLVERYQLQNLIVFFELLVKNCKNLKFIILTTNKLQSNTLNEINSDLADRGIELQVKIDNSLGDRKIVLSNGFIIKIGLGLHIFQNPCFSLGMHDYHFRKCLHTDFQNLIAFFELLVKKCNEFKYIRLITKTDPKKPDNQQSVFEQIKEDLCKRNITMTVVYEESLHDRKIVLSNGYIIKIGRGLHYFKANNPLFSLGLCDYDFRKCLQTDVDIWHTDNSL